MRRKIVAGAAVGVLFFGGTADVITVTPDTIKREPIFDTPSGYMEVGYYRDIWGYNETYLEERTIVTATTTAVFPEGLYPVEDVSGLQYAAVVGERYIFQDKEGRELKRVVDPNIGLQLRTKDAAFPTVNVSIADIVL